MNEDLLNITEKMIELYAGDPKRIQHFIKVYTFAKYIGKREKIDDKTQYTLEVAALTHDIGIHTCERKYGNCQGKLQEKEGPAIAEKLLSELNISKETIERVCFLIAHHHTFTDVTGIDWQILLEADFLVNGYEDGISSDGIKNAYINVFKTNTGKKICKEMFKI